VGEMHTRADRQLVTLRSRTRGVAAACVASLLAAAGLVFGAAPASAVSDIDRSTASAAALSGSGFDPGFIITDDLFYDSAAMTSSDIQAFLNTNVGSCLNGKCLNVATVSPPSYGPSISQNTGNTICGAVTGGSMAVSEWIFRVQSA